MSSGARQGMLMSEDTEGEKGQWALGCPWTPKAFEWKQLDQEHLVWAELNDSVISSQILLEWNTVPCFLITHQLCWALPIFKKKLYWSAVPAQSGFAADSSQTFQFQGLELLSLDTHHPSRGPRSQPPLLCFQWARDVSRGRLSRLDESDGVTATNGHGAGEGKPAPRNTRLRPWQFPAPTREDASLWLNSV